MSAYRCGPCIADQHERCQGVGCVCRCYIASLNQTAQERADCLQDVLDWAEEEHGIEPDGNLPRVKRWYAALGVKAAR